MTEQGTARESLAGAFAVDAGKVREHVEAVVRATVEQTRNALLDAEADLACGAGRYDRSPGRQDTPGATSGSWGPGPGR